MPHKDENISYSVPIQKKILRSWGSFAKIKLWISLWIFSLQMKNRQPLQIKT